MSKYRRRDNIEITQFEEEVIVYNGEQDSVHVLNQTSADILLYMEGEKSIEDIVQMMEEKYGKMEGLQNDVEEMLKQFVENNLIEELTFA